MSTPQLTILMPCLNEIETLATCINKAKTWINENSVDAEILIADNGSTDGSIELALGLGARVVSATTRGYGAALFAGCQDAQGDFIIMGDSDDSYNFSDLTLFYEALLDGNDLVMGNRFLGGIQDGAMPWKNRYIGNPALTLLGKTLFKTPSSDFHCGLRGISKQAFEELDLRTTGMEFASEMVIKASVFKKKVIEVPTTLSVDGRSRPPHLRPWRDGWRHLRFMLLFSPKWLFVYPGLAVTLISCLLFFPLLAGPVNLAEIQLNFNTLFLSESGIISGLIWVVLGIVTRFIAYREGLLAPNKIITWVMRKPTLEVGVVSGGLIWVIGLVLAIWAISSWGDRNFGLLHTGSLLRLISASSLAFMIGSLCIATSLILGFLSLPTRVNQNIKNFENLS